VAVQEFPSQVCSGGLFRARSVKRGGGVGERVTLQTVRQHLNAEYESVTEATAHLRLPTDIKFKLCLVKIKLFLPDFRLLNLNPKFRTGVAREMKRKKYEETETRSSEEIYVPQMIWSEPQSLFPLVFVPL
jgi:hypothetical protein